MVGDTAADIAFAKAVGIAGCWVSYGYGDADRCLSDATRLRHRAPCRDLRSTRPGERREVNGSADAGATPNLASALARAPEI